MSATRRTATYTATDTFTDATITGTVYDIEDTVFGWYKAGPNAAVRAILEDLFTSLRAGRIDSQKAAILGLYFTVE